MSSAERCDLLIYGGTPAGVACAIRAAREGLSVLIVTHTPHLGGMLTSGLCCWDTQLECRRSPIYDELRAAIIGHYRTAYGEDSRQHRAALPGVSGHNNGNFEPRVAQRLIEEMVAAERGIVVRRRFIPTAVQRDGRLIRTVAFTGIDGAAGFACSGRIVADCSYEGDLMSIAGISCRIGREARGEFHEPHAGRIFMRRFDPAVDTRGADAVVKQTLRLRHFPETFVADGNPDSGQGDALVQAYNWRTVLTDDSGNRLPIPAPTGAAGLDLEALDWPWFGDSLPNGKLRVNRPQLIGRQHAYTEGSWPERWRIMDDHWDAFLRVMHHLQNSPSVPEAERRRWQEFGLARDEFADNGHRPYEIYVRESRRMEGRYTLSEQDVGLAQGLQRAPVHHDSIAISEWYIDIHACSDAKRPGTLHEGKVILHDETLPGQIPLRAILPKDLDNVLVPVCLSCTHVAWGTIRLEPTWMNIGESAGLVAALAVRRGIPPADLDQVVLQQELARQRIMMGYLDDVDLADELSDAAQFFSTKGFFAGYQARLAEPLSAEIGMIWGQACAALRAGTLDVMQVARRVAAAGTQAAPVSAAEVLRWIPAVEASSMSTGAAWVTRGQALRVLFDLLAQAPATGALKARSPSTG